ncbi:gliding motility protein GldL [Proteiniphilum sp. X52]|uniref:type IX secretion system motor protein PorL/GldL n=1 Tax=Proteiniphilum sp. X52 TaxID=2382159 RepID=UPI000F09B84B|nr:gliding motility protein GldL [Proteiniphilum sp. X52]RNC66884.1 gliding motility protein GldL [Proteiniphilum sp. X52]
MNAYKKYKNSLERFLQTERGKRFINFAYSFGAAIVILGAMFKLLHFPFGNEMLFIGMVTECIVFIVSAFDTPIRDYNWEQVFPALSGNSENGDSPQLNTGMPQQTTVMSREIISGPVAQNAMSTPSGATAASHTNLSTSAGEPGYEIPHNLSAHTEEYGKQMENLNRTLSGLNSIYEIQLKSVSSQIGAIEQINQGLARLRTMYGDTLPDGSVIKAETEKMADQLRELNEVYGRMLKAMTVSKQNNSGNPNI